MPVPDYSAAPRTRVSGLRVGVARAFFFDTLDAEIERAVAAALAVIARLAASVKDVEVPAASSQEQLRSTVRAAEVYADHAEFVEKSAALYQPETLARLRAGGNVMTVGTLRACGSWPGCRRTSGRVFDGIDVLITPTSPVLPPPITEFSDDRNGIGTFRDRSIRNTSPFNVYGWPTISLPCGFSMSGLPIGLQISAATGQDARVLQLAYAYEQATDWHLRKIDLTPTGNRITHVWRRRPLRGLSRQSRALTADPDRKSARGRARPPCDSF